MTISRSIALTSQPERTNSAASQSSSSGWLGGSPWAPKSSTRLHQPGAEEHLPVAVDRHPRRQRIGRIDQPAGQAQPVGLRRSSGPARKTPRHAGLDPRPGLVVLAADQHVRRRAGPASLPSPSSWGSARRTPSSSRSRAIGSRDRAARIDVGALGRQETLGGSSAPGRPSGARAECAGSRRSIRVVARIAIVLGAERRVVDARLVDRARESAARARRRRPIRSGCLGLRTFDSAHRAARRSGASLPSM